MNEAMQNRLAGDFDPMLDIKAVTALVGISRTTIYRLRRKGEFPKAVDYGQNIIRWRKSDLEKWVEEKSKNTL